MGFAWKLENLVQADDVCLLSQFYEDMYEKLCNQQVEAATAGL
jgi:hypothetical protein